jgi:integrase
VPELTIALNTGMRPLEQYGLTWDRVDLLRCLVSIPKSKNGKARHIRLNTAALAAFAELKQRPSPDDWVFVTMYGERLCGYKHWFDPAVSAAGVRDFTWYCLRQPSGSNFLQAEGSPEPVMLERPTDTSTDAGVEVEALAASASVR